MSNTLLELIGDYWDCAYREGQAGTEGAPTEDTNRIWRQITQEIDALQKRAEKAEREVDIRDEMLRLIENNRQELCRRIDELEGKS